MVLPSDKDYLLSKKIKLEESEISADFTELAEWIENHYQVKVLNIIYREETGKEIIPKLNIVLEYGKDKIKFEDKDRSGYDKQKQDAITKQFLKILEEKGLRKKRSLLNYFSKHSNEKYLTKNLWIFFSAFEPIAKMEASKNLTKSKIDKFKTDLDDENLWEISIAFESPTFFLYKDDQIKEYESNGRKEEWKNKYFEVINQFDEFNYFKKETLSISIDSKENFDTNYESNWYYYYK